jgi:RNA polymerase sigma-70 factor (ECF subfamily)
MQCAQAISARAAVRKPSAKVISDEVLVASIATQNKNAMHTLSVHYHVRVFRFLTRLLGDAAAAEDLAGRSLYRNLAPRRLVRVAHPSVDLDLGHRPP